MSAPQPPQPPRPVFTVSQSKFFFDRNQRKRVSFDVKCNQRVYVWPSFTNNSIFFAETNEKGAADESDISIFLKYRPYDEDEKVTFLNGVFIGKFNVYNNAHNLIGSFCIQFVLKDSQAVPKCLVCDNGFGEGNQRPIVFPCGHSYCFNCAKELLKLPPANIVTCPFCRKRFCCTNDTEFVTNFAIATAVREQREIDLSSSTTLVEDPEVPCAEHKNHEATIHCKNCRADYCDMCFNKFHSSRVLSEHDTLPIEQKPTILPMCEVHKEAEGMYYCLMPECGFTFCSLCKDKHEGHQYLEVNGIITENVETMENFVQNSHLLKEKYQEEIEAKEEEIRNLPQTIEQLKITLNFDMIRNWNIAYQQIDDFAQTHKDQLMGAKKHYSDCIEEVETCNAMTLRILKRKTGLFDAEDTLGHIAKAKRFKMAQPVYQIPLVQCGAVTADFGLGPMPWPPNCSLPVQPMPLAQNCSLPVQPMPLAQNHTFPIEPVPQAQNHILPAQPIPQAQNHILPIEPMPLAQNHTLPMEPIPQAQNYILPAQPMPQAQNHILPIEAIAKAMFSMFNVWALPPAPAS